MVKEILEFLITDPGGIYIDGTIGFGGHASMILKQLNARGKILGMDRDLDALSFTEKRLGQIRSDGYQLFHSNFKNFPEILRSQNISHVNGMLLDLGMSSFDVDTPLRGFSYNHDGPLDMRFDTTSGSPASEYLRAMTGAEITGIIRMYGEERFARKISTSIVQQIKTDNMNTTFDLRDAVLNVVKGKFRMKSVSRVFQAVRISVNNELDSLKIMLDSLEQFLVIGGRAVILTFHSLEDRIVKQYFKNAAIDCICPPKTPFCICDTQPTFKILTRKAVSPSDEEVQMNSRAHSAKLRAGERI